MTTTDRFIDYLNRTDEQRKEDYVEYRREHGNKVAHKPLGIYGATNATTACGGGIRMLDCEQGSVMLVSDARNHVIDYEMRNVPGDYDGDYEMHVVIAYWPEAGVKYNQAAYGTDVATARRIAVENMAWAEEGNMKKILDRN